MHDVHAHLFHPKWYPAAFESALLRDFERRQKANGRACSTASARQMLRLMGDETGRATLEIMDRVGIEKRAILILDWGVELGEAPTSIWNIHREILGICRQHSDRLIGFAGIDPRRHDAQELVRYAFDELDARGLKLHPTSGWSLRDGATREVVALAAERSAPVLVHIGKTFDALDEANAQPPAFLELAAAFPQSAFVAGHSGFDLWQHFVRDAADIPANVFFDVAGWQERVVGDGANVRSDVRALSSAFPGRVCYGTDSPFYSFNLVTSEQHWLELIGSAVADGWAGFDELYPERPASVAWRTA